MMFCRPTMSSLRSWFIALILGLCWVHDVVAESGYHSFSHHDSSSSLDSSHSSSVELFSTRRYRTSSLRSYRYSRLGWLFWLLVSIAASIALCCFCCFACYYCSTPDSRGGNEQEVLVEEQGGVGTEQEVIVEQQPEEGEVIIDQKGGYGSVI
mmetsp:Transcript_8172/g.18956  ORF Transcript_8172/g.18956 Transcript_8172/m.18956 type:complete len:153 (-) Transcript_8172:28-486(-)